MPTFAAVDIGSNSVRLKIAKVVRGRLHTLHEDREVTRLGESVFGNGSLDPEAMSLTIRCCNAFIVRCRASPPIACGLSPPLRCAIPATAVPSSTGYAPPRDGKRKSSPGWKKAASFT